MIYSKTTEYAINALVYMASRSKDKFSGSNDIASAVGIPGPFLGKILQILRENDLVESVRGRSGGFRLALPADDIALYDVVATIENLHRYEMCLFDSDACTRERPCSTVCDWNDVLLHITKYLEEHSIADLLDVREFRLDSQFDKQS